MDSCKEIKIKKCENVAVLLLCWGERMRCDDCSAVGILWFDWI